MNILSNNTIKLDKSYDSSSAPEFEKELFEAVNSLYSQHNRETLLTLDASDLEYISSAGLRVLLKLKKQQDALTIINVSPSVYQLFDLTGFTGIIRIRRAIREIDMTGAIEIGHGLSSHVYRLNDDIVVKLYVNRIPLWKVEREFDNAKKAFLAGIPCVMSYDIVKSGDCYGLVFELMKSRGVSRILNDAPGKFDDYAAKYIDLLKEVHSMEMDETFEEIKPLWHSWADLLSSFLTDEELSTIHTLIDAVPDRNTFVHSDAHVNNIMELDGKLVFADLADIGRGHPVFDIGPILFHYHYMSKANKELCESGIVLREDLREKMYEVLLENYLKDDDPKRHNALKEIYDCFAALRCGLIAAKHAQLETSEKQLFVDTMKKHLFYRSDRVLELMKEYL